jgi:predicted esterase
MAEEGDGRPILVGHSKAGNLAAYISSEFGHTDAYLFNPMPLHNNLVNEENLQSSNIHTHVAKNDFIAPFCP